MTEQQIQSACVRWLWNTYPETRGLFFAVNNNSEHIARGMNRKAAGVVPGVSDTVFFWRGQTYLIEFKTGKGRQSDVQKRWERTVKENGFDYYIVRSESEFRELIESIIKTP